MALSPNENFETLEPGAETWEKTQQVCMPQCRSLMCDDWTGRNQHDLTRGEVKWLQESMTREFQGLLGRLRNMQVRVGLVLEHPRTRSPWLQLTCRCMPRG